MNLAELHKKLMAAARANPPSAHVPYAFEQRIMARLTSRPAVDEWAGWIRSLWCAAGVCAAIALLMGVWTAMSASEPELGAGFCQELEQTIWASTSTDPSETTW
jgi:hypothetical protein